MKEIELHFFSSVEELYAYQGEPLNCLLFDMKMLPNMKQQLSETSVWKEKRIVFKRSCPDGEIPESAIRYLRSESNYVRVYLEEKTILYAKTLKVVEQMTKGSDIIRIHKSVMVNLAYVEGIRNNHVILYDQTCLPIGRTYKEKARQLFTAYKSRQFAIHFC